MSWCSEHPPGRALLIEPVDRVGMTPRELRREKGTPYAELGLSDTSLSEGALVDAVMLHSILINRPLVVSPVCAFPKKTGNRRSML